MSTLSVHDRRMLLRRNSLLGKLDDLPLDQILSFAVERRFGGGETIFAKGDTGSGLMAVLSGRVKIRIYSEEGKEVTYNVIEEGEVFGEIALLDGRERSADAVAMGECLVLTIERRDFVPFLRRNPDVALQLLGILCERLRGTCVLFEDVVFSNLAARLARLLLKLTENYGKPTHEGLLIDLKLSQRELGSFVATSRESINKQLRAWKEDQLIDFEDGYLTIRELRSIRDLAGVEF